MSGEIGHQNIEHVVVDGSMVHTTIVMMNIDPLPRID